MVFCSLKVERIRVGGIKKKKRRNDDTGVEKRETDSQGIREANYTADHLIFSSAVTVL